MAVDDRRRRPRARVRVSAWRGHDDVALLAAVADRGGLHVDDVAAEVDRLANRGVRRILTGALHSGELGPFLAAGFVEHERLRLLRHDLLELPPAPERVRLRRARRRDQAAVLDIDARAFDAFWTLDRVGLADAVRATPVSRFRLADDGSVSAYAITGRASDRGYLQRLAVDPDHHRQHIASALIADSLRWLRRNGARLAVVNTQEHNDAAYALYRSNGFVPEPKGLTVLVHHLGSKPEGWPSPPPPIR